MIEFSISAIYKTLGISSENKGTNFKGLRLRLFNIL